MIKGIKAFYIPLIFFLILLFILGNIIFSFQLITSINENENLVNHTYTVISSLQNTLIALTRTENFQRNYVILQQDTYLTAYKNSLPDIEKQMKQLLSLTKDNQIQQKNTLLLQQEINQRLNSLQMSITILQNNGFEAEQQYLSTSTGIKKMDTIRNLVAAMNQEEKRLLTIRESNTDNSYQDIYTTIALAGLLNIFLIALTYYLIKRELKKRSDLEVRKDEFISMASHELKTPLTSMKIFAQILEKDLAKTNLENAKKYVKKINEQTQKLHVLVTELLDISRIQTEKLRFDTTALDLRELIVETVEALQATTRQHQIIFKSTTHVTIMGDRFRIYQVLTNLLTNAIKYSPDGGKIIVRLQNENEFAKISVKDSGIGIDTEHQKRIFERLYQIQDNTVQKSPGLGIGLYVASEIVKRHQGKIWVESRKGKGATFYFTLPMQQKIAYQKLLSPMQISSFKKFKK